MLVFGTVHGKHPRKPVHDRDAVFEPAASDI